MTPEWLKQRSPTRPPRAAHHRLVDVTSARNSERSEGHAQVSREEEAAGSSAARLLQAESGIMECEESFAQTSLFFAQFLNQNLVVTLHCSRMRKGPRIVRTPHGSAFHFRTFLYALVLPPCPLLLLCMWGVALQH
jgi:hypothetical protein